MCEHCSPDIGTVCTVCNSVNEPEPPAQSKTLTITKHDLNNLDVIVNWLNKLPGSQDSVTCLKDLRTRLSLYFNIA